MSRHLPWRLPCALVVALCAAPGPQPAVADSLPSLRVGPDPQAERPDPVPGAALAPAVSAARSHIGASYAMGATGPGAFDCSGLTAAAFRGVGVDLPHSSFAQFARGRAVAREDVRSGDLVFFDTNGPGASHVGVATARGTVISATSSGVMEHPMDDAYWGAAYVGARRLRVS